LFDEKVTLVYYARAKFERWVLSTARGKKGGARDPMTAGTTRSIAIARRGDARRSPRRAVTHAESLIERSRESRSRRRVCEQSRALETEAKTKPRSSQDGCVH
jgi:hypothetical protein